jgi:hypothetical protein
MDEPRNQTIVVHFSAHEHNLIDGLATLRGMSAGELVRELIGFERGHSSPRHLRLVPTKSEGEAGQARKPVSPSACKRDTRIPPAHRAVRT